jgi:hypothetical protein
MKTPIEQWNSTPRLREIRYELDGLIQQQRDGLTPEAEFLAQRRIQVLMDEAKSYVV